MTVTVNDAKTHLSELLERASAGEDITITKHGKVIAKLTRADSSNRRQFGRDARELSERELLEATRPLNEMELEGWLPIDD